MALTNATTMAGLVGSALTFTPDAGGVSAGIVTASTFSGSGSDITGVTASGLSGSPNVTVGFLTATGSVTIGGTLTYDDVTNIDSVGLVTARNGLQVLAGYSTFTGPTIASDLNVTGFATVATLAATKVNFTGATETSNLKVSTGIATVVGQTNLANVDISGFSTANVNYFNNVAEKMVRVSAAGSVGICTYSSTANIIYFDAPNGDAVIKITGVPQDSSFDNSSIVVSAILRTTGTGRSVHPYLNINGVDRSIKFSGGSRNEATSGVTTTNGYTIYNFIGINTAGSASTAANYEVLGCVSGGFF